ncbi:ABC transporter substrate-binding protein [Casimicrobium huifangae]|uniref:ABC transporter substrate-binding protein n=1 Tax=Casimicrobium huifangae TaxID=2591109 RepID=UPI001396792B|nr:ABC transporter substrate-binding protein [Casimicrobium huifangae]
MKFSIRTLSASLFCFGLTGTFAASASAQELRFSWWGGGERHEAMLKAARLFEAKNPGVKIKAEYSGFQGYQERLSTQIAGRNEPDVMQVNWAWLSAFSKNGEGFYDLRKAGAAVKTSEFSEHDLALTTINGKLNALPVGFTARIFYWNKAVLDKAGVAMPKTWDDLFTAGKAFRAKVGDKGYLLDGNLYDLILVSHAYAYQKHGTPWIDARTGKVAMSAAALKDWVAFYKRLQDENVATPLPYRASLGGVEKPVEQQPDWVAGNWGGVYTWDSTVRVFGSTLPGKGKELEVGDFLTLPGAKNSGMFGRPVHVYAVSKRSKQPELAAKFASFMLTDPEAIRILDVTRGIPASAIAFQILQKEDRLRPIEVKAYARISTQQKSNAITPPAPQFEHPRVQKFVREVFEAVGYGKMTPDEAAKQLNEQGSTILNRL